MEEKERKKETTERELRPARCSQATSRRCRGSEERRSSSGGPARHRHGWRLARDAEAADDAARRSSWTAADPTAASEAADGWVAADLQRGRTSGAGGARQRRRQGAAVRGRAGSDSGATAGRIGSDEPARLDATLRNLSAVTAAVVGERRRAGDGRRRGSGADGTVARCRPLGCAISTKSRRREGAIVEIVVDRVGPLASESWLLFICDMRGLGLEGRGLVLNPMSSMVVRRYYPGPWMVHSRPSILSGSMNVS
ncbi:hypothetical protein Scep_002087 [Stephania cephalantha]|uniref:Uncharacterized protein n=1 Tax=Stephania cephalantha TaxID=152367 RepID=A0AAP0L9G6_9MAGN